MIIYDGIHTHQNSTDEQEVYIHEISAPYICFMCQINFNMTELTKNTTINVYECNDLEQWCRINNGRSAIVWQGQTGKEIMPVDLNFHTNKKIRFTLQSSSLETEIRNVPWKLFYQIYC